MTDRYAKAAQDGYLEVLKEATKKDCNMKDEDGMTPTLWAAFEGNIDALRLIVLRGGDPEKFDNYGNTALHLASAKGHMECVTFLVNFGVNLWCLDIDMHTPQELAAMNDRTEILRFLDGIASQQELDDKKKVQKMKDKAQKNAQQLLKDFKKIQKKAEKMAEKEDKELTQEMEKIKIQTEPSKNMEKRESMVVGTAPRFSEMVNAGTAKSKKSVGSVFKKANNKKKQRQVVDDDQFKITSDITDGKRTVRTIDKGLRRGSEVIFLPKDPNEEPDDRTGDHPPPNLALFEGRRDTLGLFDRPGVGNLHFRNSMTASMYAFSNLKENEGSIGSAGSLDRGSHDDEDITEDFAGINLFLAGHGLQEWISTFVREKVDLNILMDLDENDLKEMGIPTGPRKVLMKAIKDRKQTLDEDSPIEDSKL